MSPCRFDRPAAAACLCSVGGKEAARQGDLVQQAWFTSEYKGARDAMLKQHNPPRRWNR